MSRFRWQNLTQEEERTSRRRWPRHGRCWWWLGEYSVGFEWVLFKRGCAASAQLDPSEGELTFGLSPLFASFYLTLPMPRWLESRLPRQEGTSRAMDGKAFSYPLPRRVSLSLHDGLVSWCLWRDDGSWSPNDWRQNTFNWKRFVFGKTLYSDETLDERDVVVPMPEGPYPGKARLYVSTWQRAGWPWWPLTRRMTRCGIEVEAGIPVPGKGENSWDCDDDAMFSVTAPARTIEEGVAAVVGHALQKRQRYGGNRWKPRVVAALAALLLIAAPAAAEVGIVPGQSPAIPSERFAWCGRVPTAAGWSAKPLTIDLAASGGDWVAAQIAAAERVGAPAGVIPVAGVIGAELRQSLKGWADELCRAGKLGPWQAPVWHNPQAPAPWSCSATSRETEIMGGFPASCAGVNPVRVLWMSLFGPSVPERALRSDQPHEPCGLRRVGSVFGDQEWQVNESPLCGQVRPPTVLAPPYFAGPVPEEVRTRPGAQRIASRPASWPPAACYYDSRGGFGSGVVLWVDVPACRGEVPPVDPPDPPRVCDGDWKCEPDEGETGENCADCVLPPVEPPPSPSECDLAPVLNELEAVRAELQALRTAMEAAEVAADARRDALLKTLGGHHSTLYTHTSTVCRVRP
jgi:hypothetical protein